MVAAVETWEAELLEQVKENGRTKPMVLSCKRAGGGVHERRPFVVKAMGSPEMTAESLRNEFLGMLLARELGLAVTGPTLIEIPGDVAAAINPNLRRYGFQIMNGTAVGSLHLTGLVPVGPRMDLSQTALNEAAAVYAFDLLTQNPDRSVKNPNCALCEGHVFPYDFELCFSFTRTLFGGGDPVELGTHGICGPHVFRPILRKLSKFIDFDPFFEGIARVTKKGRLDALVAALPEEWRAGTDAIRGHILAVSSRVDDFRVELVKTLV